MSSSVASLSTDASVLEAESVVSVDMVEKELVLERGEREGYSRCSGGGVKVCLALEERDDDDDDDDALSSSSDGEDKEGFREDEAIPDRW